MRNEGESSTQTEKGPVACSAHSCPLAEWGSNRALFLPATQRLSKCAQAQAHTEVQCGPPFKNPGVLNALINHFYRISKVQKTMPEAVRRAIIVHHVFVVTSLRTDIGLDIKTPVNREQKCLLPQPTPGQGCIFEHIQ